MANQSAASVMIGYWDTFSTPFGPFSLAVDEAGAVIATAFGSRRALESRLGSRCLEADGKRTSRSRAQVLAYCEGRRRRFELNLAPAGSSFQRQVWAALATIPFGSTCSYGELARSLGRPGAARAVGRANASNPICLLLPCHRVIGANGSLTGFAFGEKLKRRLLEHEAGDGARFRAA